MIIFCPIFCMASKPISIHWIRTGFKPHWKILLVAKLFCNLKWSSYVCLSIWNNWSKTWFSRNLFKINVWIFFWRLPEPTSLHYVINVVDGFVSHAIPTHSVRFSTNLINGTAKTINSCKVFSVWLQNRLISAGL